MYISHVGGDTAQSAAVIFYNFFFKRKKERESLETNLERKFPHQLLFWTPVKSSITTQATIRKHWKEMCWNDERLSQKMVEKWPIYCPPPFGSLNGFLFSNQCTASWRTLEGRVSAENRGCDHSRELTCRECDKEGFHVTGPGVLFLWGHRELQQNMSRSEGGQSAFQCIFPPVNKAAHERNQYELAVLVKKTKKQL